MTALFHCVLCAAVVALREWFVIILVIFACITILPADSITRRFQSS